MELFFYLRYFVFVADVCLFFLVLLKNPKSNINRFAALFIGFFALWSSSAMLMWISPEYDLWFTFGRIAGMGYTGFPAAFFLFSVSFVGGFKKNNYLKFLYPVLFAIWSFFVYLVWSGKLLDGALKEWYGWYPIWSEGVWANLFNIYYAGLMILSLLIIIVFGVRTRSKTKRKQVIIIASTMSIVLVVGSLFDIILIQQMRLTYIPGIADIILLIWVGGVAYAITKYKFLSISISSAAEDMISIMGDAMILLDKDLKIVQSNEAAKKMFGYSKSQLNGKPISKYINDSKFLEKIEKICKIVDHEAYIKNKKGKKMSILLSASCLSDDSGDILGTVLVAKDISEMKKIQSNLKSKVEELKKVNDVMIGREMKIIELKKELKKNKGLL